MTPRRYEKRQRAVTTGETRRRILQASLSLHSEKGFAATSWQEIAERADVAVGTVYYHFPTLDELVPACGALASEFSNPPDASIFDGLRSRSQRTETLVREVFALYGRVAPALSNVFRERIHIAAVDVLATERERAVGALVREALGKDVPAAVANRVEALTDFRVWDSFRSRGVAQEVIVQTIATMIQGLISKSSRPILDRRPHARPSDQR